MEFTCIRSHERYLRPSLPPALPIFLGTKITKDRLSAAVLFHPLLRSRAARRQQSRDAICTAVLIYGSTSRVRVTAAVLWSLISDPFIRRNVKKTRTHTHIQSVSTTRCWTVESGRYRCCIHGHYERKCKDRWCINLNTQTVLMFSF